MDAPPVFGPAARPFRCPVRCPFAGPFRWPVPLARFARISPPAAPRERDTGRGDRNGKPGSEIMAGDSFVPLPGSERGPVPGLELTGPVDGGARVEVTLVTRRRAALPAELVLGPATLTPAQMAEQHGTDPGEGDLIREVLSERGIEVTQTYTGSRCVKASGTLTALAETFGASLSMVRSDHPAAPGGRAEHRYREGALRIPARLDGIVLAVLGLDNRPQARPQFRIAGASAGADGAGRPAAASTSYTPPQIAGLYEFPARTDGTGQTLAILEFGGGFASSDLDSYFSGLGIPAPSVTAASVDGTVNQPGHDASGADGEVMLDIEVAGAVAPGGSHSRLLRAQHRPGIRGRGHHGRARHHQPAASCRSAGARRKSPGRRRRMTASTRPSRTRPALGVTVMRGRRRQRLERRGHRTARATPTFPPPARTHWPAAAPACAAIRPPASSARRPCGTTGPAAAPPAAGSATSRVAGLAGRRRRPAVGRPGRAGRGVPDVAGNADPHTGY